MLGPALFAIFVSDVPSVTVRLASVLDLTVKVEVLPIMTEGDKGRH